MTLDLLREWCTSFPFVTEDVKWGNDLCFLIGGKMFCVVSLESPLTVSFKVNPDEFETLIGHQGISPAPYVARYHWILVTDMQIFKQSTWKIYLHQSYELVKNKLTKKALKELS